MQVVWSEPAIADLIGIRAYIAQFNPYAAADMAARLLQAADGLEHFAHRGRPVGPGLRELAVIHPYVIRYRIEADRVLVLRVRHGRRKPGP